MYLCCCFFFFFTSFSWPWLEAPCGWCNLAPSTFSPGNRDFICEIAVTSVLSPIRNGAQEAPSLKAWLRAPGHHWKKKVWALVSVSDRLVDIWFYGFFMDTETCVIRGVICKPQQINEQGMSLAVGILVGLSAHRRRALCVCPQAMRRESNRLIQCWHIPAWVAPRSGDNTFLSKTGTRDTWSASTWKEIRFVFSSSVALRFRALIRHIK